MVATPSVMRALGTQAPEFELQDVVSGRTVTLGQAAGPKGTLVMFISRHCPYVQHVKHELARVAREYRRRGIGIVAISSNDVASHPDDAPDKLKEMAEELDLAFPLCYDPEQSAARAYQAACTPDFFLFDAERRLVYRGQLDDSRPKNDRPVTGRDLRAALDAVAAGRTPPAEQMPSLGCNIKWKPGNEPPYGRPASG